MSEAAVPVAPRPLRADRFLLLLLALSLSANVALALSVLRFTNQSTSAAPKQAGPSVGTQLPPFDAVRFGGSRETIDYSNDQRPTLLYVFTPSCIWCARNLANLRLLVEHAKADYRILALSLDPDVESYLARTGLDVATFINPSSATVSAYGFGSTPQTLVISPQGKVLKAWVGAYGGVTKQDVEATFGLKLPGVTPPKTSN